jgi:hypothetical protein
MSLGIRVRMSPLASGLGQADQIVSDGAIVSLVQLGRPPSKLTRGAGLPTRLTFQGQFLESVRAAGGEDIKDLATLNGTLLLEDGATTFVFTGDQSADGPIGLEPTEVVGDEDDATDDDPREVRLLRFAFDSAQFKEVSVNHEPLELALRVDAARFDYCEVSVTLEIDGQVEAAATTNDALDVLITARNPARRELVAVRFTDETGAAMPGAAVSILSGAKPVKKGADPQALIADGNGEVLLRNVPGAPTCELAWGPAPDKLIFKKKLFLELGDETLADERRLVNLSYPTDRSLSENVHSFQADFARPATGRIADVSQDLVAFHDDGARPALGDATEPSSEAVAVNGPRTRDFDDLQGAADGADVAIA